MVGQSSCDRSLGDWFQKVWYEAPEGLVFIWSYTQAMLSWPGYEASPHQILAGKCYYKLITTTKLSMPVPVVVTLEKMYI